MRLIFFASSDPGSHPKPIWSAYHFAEVASRADLDAEVRLAGDAVKVAKEGTVAQTELGFDVRAKVIHGAHAPYLVSLWPGCVGTREVSEEEVEGIGGVIRPLAEILTEVAQGRSTLIYLG